MNDRIKLEIRTESGSRYFLKLRHRQDVLGALDKMFGTSIIKLTDCTGFSVLCGEHASITGCRIAQAVTATLLFARAKP